MDERSSPTVRAAVADDRERLWRWRNDPRVRRGSHDPGEIQWEDHVAWFERTLASDSVVLLVGELDGEPCGVGRFDLDPGGREAEVSIYLDPARIGTGLGGRLLAAALDHLRRTRPAAARVRARVRSDNPASLAVFRRAGFAERHRLLVLDLARDDDG